MSRMLRVAISPTTLNHIEQKLKPSPVSPTPEVSEMLTHCAAFYETADFLNGDPSWFMHQVSGTANQEVMAFLASCLAYGNRRQFMPRIQFLLNICEGEPALWITSGKYSETIPDDPTRCFYRLHTFHNVNALLNRLHQILSQHATLGSCLRSSFNSDKVSASEVLHVFVSSFHTVDTGGLVPKSTLSCCKRLCMFLRWMVRDNSPVDLGLWTDFIDKTTLIMPLDTHVVRQAQNLGLLTSSSASMYAALRLTAQVKTIFPHDPLLADFALFGYGINDKKRPFSGQY